MTLVPLLPQCLTRAGHTFHWRTAKQQNESQVNLVQRGGYAPVFQNVSGVKTPADISEKCHRHLKFT